MLPGCVTPPPCRSLYRCSNIQYVGSESECGKNGKREPQRWRVTVFLPSWLLNSRLTFWLSSGSPRRLRGTKEEHPPWARRFSVGTGIYCCSGPSKGGHKVVRDRRMTQNFFLTLTEKISLRAAVVYSQPNAENRRAPLRLEKNTAKILYENWTLARYAFGIDWEQACGSAKSVKFRVRGGRVWVHVTRSRLACVCGVRPIVFPG